MHQDGDEDEADKQSDEDEDRKTVAQRIPSDLVTDRIVCGNREGLGGMTSGVIADRLIHFRGAGSRCEGRFEAGDVGPRDATGREAFFDDAREFRWYLLGADQIGIFDVEARYTRPVYCEPLGIVREHERACHHAPVDQEDVERPVRHLVECDVVKRNGVVEEHHRFPAELLEDHGQMLVDNKLTVPTRWRIEHHRVDNSIVGCIRLRERGEGGDTQHRDEQG
jgi:hypothetical protein